MSKDEIVGAVWPKVIVTDASLAQCIRDVRGVLGDDGNRFIRTIPRRGYLFVPHVQQVPAGEGPETAPAAPAAVAAAATRLPQSPPAVEAVPAARTVPVVAAMDRPPA